jgi:ribosomal protein S27AE
MTLKSGDYPWIIIDANKDPLGKQKFVCMRCGQEHILTIDGLSIEAFLKLSESFCELHKDCKHQYYDLKSEKIVKEFDKLNTDDFCAWFLEYHIDLFEKLHKEYLKDACLTPEEIKDFKIDFNMLKKELKQK